MDWKQEVHDAVVDELIRAETPKENIEIAAEYLCSVIITAYDIGYANGHKQGVFEEGRSRSEAQYWKEVAAKLGQ